MSIVHVCINKDGYVNASRTIHALLYRYRNGAVNILWLNAVAEEVVQKWGGYINFQDTFAWRNLQSYAGLVKSGGATAP